MRSFRSRAGFTLAESLAASVILAVAVVGVSGALIAAQQQSGVQQRTHVMTMLGQQLIERVTALPLQKADGTTGLPGWPAVADASRYDTLDDFAGYSDVVDAGPSLEARTAGIAALSDDGTDLRNLNPAQSNAAGADAVRRSVAISYPTSMFGKAVAVGDWAVVKVTIRPASGESMSLTRMVCRWTAQRSG